VCETRASEFAIFHSSGSRHVLLWLTVRVITQNFHPPAVALGFHVRQQLSICNSFQQSSTLALSRACTLSACAIGDAKMRG
jgi:hypothetical protein